MRRGRARAPPAPAAVRVAVRPDRSISVAPRSCSSCRIWALTPDWLMCTRSAARVKFASSATATKYSSCLSSITRDSSYEQNDLLDFCIGTARLDSRWNFSPERKDTCAGQRESPASPKTSPACSSSGPTTGDAAGIAALYEEHAVMAYPPGSQTVGRDAIRALWEKVLAERAALRAGATAADPDQRRHRPHLHPAQGRRRRPGPGGPPAARRHLAATARPARVHPARPLIGTRHMTRSGNQDRSRRVAPATAVPWWCRRSHGATGGIQSAGPCGTSSRRPGRDQAQPGPAGDQLLELTPGEALLAGQGQAGAQCMLAVGVGEHRTSDSRRSEPRRTG